MNVTGPHVGLDKHGNFDHTFYRCEGCGVESTDPNVPHKHNCPKRSRAAGVVR